ncbi:MAG: hypothetical protein AB7V42_12530 [Thermoleophilia bacterium]
MTLRTAALVLAVVLSVPAVVAILAMSRGTAGEDATPGRRRLNALWVATPIVLLAGLIVLSAAA